MKQQLSPRVKGFLAHVEQVQPREVVQEFRRLLNANGAGPDVRLSYLLEEARRRCKKTMVVERAMLQDSMHCCNS